MNKKISIVLFVIFFIIIIGGVIYFNDMIMNESLEMHVPFFAKRETIELKEKRFLDNEELIIIYLSKSQMNAILKKIRKNENWKKTKLDDRLIERLEFHTRESIFKQMPDVANYYWIFTNRSNGIKDKHSVDELIDDGLYYAISFGLIDLDNNILYFYRYDS